jgi:hypothetical protein
MPVNLMGMLPPEEQARMHRTRAAIKELIDGQSLNEALTALEVTLGEVLAAHVWAGTDLGVQLARSHMMVDAVAQAVESANGGRA